MTHRTLSAALKTAAAALAVAILASCNSNAAQPSGSADSSGSPTTSATGGSAAAPQVVSIPKLLGPSYFEATLSGMKTAAQELGGTIEQVGPSEATAAGQIEFINSSISTGARAIAIAGNDPEALRPALQEAMKAGVAVVSYDSDVAVDARQIFVNQAHADGVAKALVKELGEGVGTGQVAIVSSTPTNTNQNAWIDLMKTEMAASYPDLELVEVVYGDDLTDKVQQVTQNLLQSYPDLKGIAAITGVAEPAAAGALANANRGGQIVLTGVATPGDMRSYLKDGTARSAVLWDVPKLGYLTYYAAAALQNGQITGAEGETFEAGSAGTYTIGKDGEVLLGDPLVLNADNVDQYDF